MARVPFCSFRPRVQNVLSKTTVKTVKNLYLRSASPARTFFYSQAYRMESTSAGSTVPAEPRRVYWTCRVSGVSSGLTSTTTAPAGSASNGSEAAGCTSPDVPTDKKRSQLWAASKASPSASAGSASPNQTTSGRKEAAQRGQEGGTSVSSARGSTTTPSREHFERQMLPCSSTTFRLPARRCRPSTFWVTREKEVTYRSRSAKASCPGFGIAFSTSSRRQAYHSHTRPGSRPKAS